MQITEIHVKLGLTQNLGDYSNCRPEVEIVAHLDDGDSPSIALDRLIDETRRRLHAVVDDELEAAGRETKYYAGQLYRVGYNDHRQCIAIYRDNVTPPEESNWKISDHWHRDHSAPLRMRLNTAVATAHQLADRTGYRIWTIEEADFGALPPLPSFGPQPGWHKKGLQHSLERLGIPQDHWDAIAALDHADANYLSKLYRYNLETFPLEVRLATIITGSERPLYATAPTLWGEEEE